MNLSGKAVSLSLRSISKRPSSRSIIAIHDSLDHAPMTIRPKASGSAEGHNGVKSIIASLGGNMNFARLRLGIGRPEGGKIPIDQYVLGTMSQPELKFWGEGGVGVDKVWEALVGIMVEEAKAQQQ
jgi:PTH1 family peptidyl-tRNA hydrolase